MAKFKIGFTIEAETLFGMLSKFLPVDDLHVEELAPTPLNIPAMVTKMYPELSAHAPKSKPKSKYHKRPPKPMDLTSGINKIIVEALAGGEKTAIELRPLLAERDYSANSVGSRLQCLREHGVIDQLGDGAWQLTKKLKYASPPTDTIEDGLV